jgi:hypothetical protein
LASRPESASNSPNVVSPCSQIMNGLLRRSAAAVSRQYVSDVSVIVPPAALRPGSGSNPELF